MTDLGRTLAVIPARGGSTRVPEKNLQDVGGRPLVAHAIAHAEAAGHVDRAIVSTDDEEIARVARDYGGDVPFKRPPELATNTAPVSGTITHALDWAESSDGPYDSVCVLQVTCPLREPADVDGALTRLAEADAMSVVSVSEYVTPPQWAVRTDEEGYLADAFEIGELWTDEPKRSQDLDGLRHPNGAVFAVTTGAWRTHESFYTPRTVGYEMPPERSFDVDEPWELELVRTLYDRYRDDEAERSARDAGGNWAE